MTSLRFGREEKYFRVPQVLSMTEEPLAVSMSMPVKRTSRMVKVLLFATTLGLKI